MSGGLPGVSVALCTHNGERFIEEQLESILRQTAPPREIVISDDASSDSTLTRARTLVAALQRADVASGTALRVIENSTALGVTSNFQQAIAACTSELIALCDQDDRWQPGRLAAISEAFNGNPSLHLLHSDARLIDEAGSLLPGTLFKALGFSAAAQQLVHDGHAFEVLMRRNVVTGATVVIRRTLADLATPFPPEWLHDEWLAIISATLGEMDVVPAALIEYRQHANNQIGVQMLSTRGKLARMSEQGDARNRRLLSRATVLHQRLLAMGETVLPQRLAEVSYKVEHEWVRSRLPRLRRERLLPVLRELRTGRYAKYGRGVPDAVRDLIQPLGGPS
jgi:glycosyltransferase involved in cell wall biosynthesis